MEKTRQNVVNVALILSDSDEWFNTSEELVTLLWDYVYMSEYTINELIWHWKWMLGTNVNIKPATSTELKRIKMEMIIEDGYVIDWDYLLKSYLPTDEQWEEILYHYGNII